MYKQLAFDLLGHGCLIMLMIESHEQGCLQRRELKFLSYLILRGAFGTSRKALKGVRFKLSGRVGHRLQSR